MTTLINTPLAETTKGHRIWAQGRKLLRQGWNIGDTYNRVSKNGVISLIKCENGTKIVSRKKLQKEDMPLIDINNKQIGEILGLTKNVRIVIRRNVIKITAHRLTALMQKRISDIREKLEKKQKLSKMGLFIGGGVLDSAIHSGLNKSGVSSFVQVGVELVDKYIESNLKNNPELWTEDSIVINSPIQLVNFTENTFQSNILCAGIPCLGASNSGKAKLGLKHAESHPSAGALFFYFLKAVEASNAAIIVLENVMGYQNSASMEVIRSVLDTLGYDLQEQCFNGNKFGALENRDRLVAVAVTKGLDIDFDLEGVLATQTKETALNEILEPIPLDSDMWKPYDYLTEKEKSDIKKKKGFRLQRLTGAEEHCGTVGKGYNRARGTEPFICHPTNPKLFRLLTPIEHARIKKIPIHIIEGNSVTLSHEILGQSVIYSVFEDIAQNLGEKLVAMSEQYKEEPERLAA
jgi:DNA (cytosine-5)-methyltransferase 1